MMRQETDKTVRPGRRRSRLKALLSLVLAFGGVALLWAYHCVDSAPPDPFDGQPLRFDRSRGWLWSAGRDGKEAGGEKPDPEEWQLDLDEPTLKLGFR